MSLKDLPSPNAPNFQLRVREMLHTILGKNGSVDDRLLTLREAIAAGVVKPGPGGSLVPGDAIRGGTGGETYEPDLTPPPTPTGFSVDPAIGYVFIQHDAPLYLQGHGHLRTRVYGVTHTAGSPLPVFADAVEVGQFEGTVWALPSNPATTWHLWIKWETRDGVLSASPAGGTNGAVATTAQDVALLLDALAGQIGSSQLANDLATRIDLIDGDGPGSVTQRIADEATARAAAILDEADARVLATNGLQDQINLLAEAAGGDLSDLLDVVNQEREDRISAVLNAENAAATADSVLSSALVTEALARAGEDRSLAAQASAIAAATAGNAAAVVQEQQARTTDTSALASATAALATSSAGNAAAIRTEEQSRTDADSAQAARVQAVSASAADSAAAVRTEQSARAEDDNALAAQSFVLAAKTAENTSGLVQEAAVRSTADSAAAAVSAGILAQAQGAASAISVEQAVSAEADAALAAQSALQVSQLGAQAAAIQQETLTRATDDAALSQQATLLSAQAGEQAAAVRTEAATRADADTAQALQTQAVSAAAGQGLAAVRTEESARVDADTAQASTSSVLAASLAGNVAAIVSEQSVRTSGDATLAQRVDALAATTASSAAAISTQQKVTADQDSALAQQVANLGTSVGNNAASIAMVSQTVADNFDAQSSQITTLQASAGAAPGLTRLRFWGFDSGLEGWSSTYATASSGVVTWTPTVSNSSFIRNLATAERYLGANAPVIRARVRRVSGSGAWEGNIYYSTAAHGASTSYRKTISAPSNPDAWNELEWDMSQLTAGGTDYLDNEITALRIDLVSDANTSVWEFDWVAVGSRSVTPQDVALQTEATVRATETGDLFAKYTVKVDVAGHVSGYGLASTANNGAVVSQFGIRADQFFVAPPATSSATAPTIGLYKGMVWVDTSVTPNVTRYYTGSAWSTTPQALPFVVQTTPTTINGVAVPPGAYFNDAFIQNGTITNAKIANLAVDDAKIANLSVSKLTAGSLAVGQYAQSTGYVAGSSGWRINGDGTAEFSGVVVRGTIFASQGAIGGWTIGSNYLQSTTYVLGTSGTRLNSDGTGQIGGITIYSQGLGAGSTAYDTGNGAWIGRDGKFSLKSATNSLKWDGSTLQINGGGTFSGALSAATGTFAGSLSAATGTFSGSLTADAVNAVNTINLAGQAVTIPVGVYSSGVTPDGSYAQTATIISTGAPIVISASVVISNNQDNISWNLRRNGVLIFQGPSVFSPSPLSVAFNVIDTPGAGTHTYQLGASSSSSHRSLVLLEVKK